MSRSTLQRLGSIASHAPIDPGGGSPPPDTDPRLGRWYQSTSAFNTQIPLGTPAHADSATMIAAFVDLMTRTGQGFGLGPTLSSVPKVIYPDNTTTSATVQKNWNTCGNGFFSVPIPVGTVVENIWESTATVLIDSGETWDFFKLTEPGLPQLYSGGGPQSQCPTNPAYWNATVVAHYLPGEVGCWTARGYGQTSGRASKTSQGAGIMRIRDLRDTPVGGDWGHALNQSTGLTVRAAQSVKPAFVHPAGGTDGTNCGGAYTDIQCIPMGARLQLDPALNVDTWPSLVGKPEWMKQCARTMQKYGWIITDTATPNIGGFENEYQSTGRQMSGTQLFNGLGGFNWSNYRIPADLFAQCRVLDWSVQIGA